MARVLVFSDLQAHTHKAYSKRTGDGQNSRLEVALEVLESLREFCVASGIRDAFFAGDLFETNNRVPVTVTNAVADEFAQWQKAGIKMLMIPGNHDHAVRSGAVHAMEFLHYVGRGAFTVLSEPGIINYRLSSGTQIRVTAMPYRRHFNDPTKMPHPLIKTVNAKYSILLAHGNVEGFCPQPFKAPEDDDGSKPVKDWIRSSWLSAYDRAFVGHIHQRGEKVVNGCPVVSPGCPYQENASALGENRGFYVWDTDTNECKPYNVAGVPKFVTVKIPVVGDVQWPEDVDGDIILLQPESTAVPYEAIRGAKERLYGAGAEYVDTRPAIDQVSPKSGDSRAVIEDSQDPIKVLGEVLDNDMVNMRGTSREDLELIGHQVVAAARAESSTSPGIVQLDSIEGRDILCFQGIEIDLNSRGLIGVGGENMDTSHADSNGTGKSSMFDLIAWALYGRTLRDLRADSVIRRGRSGCRTLIRFTSADGTTYEVFRSRNDRIFGSDLHFHKVGKVEHTIDGYAPSTDPLMDLRGQDKKDTQARLERTLGLSFDAFRSLVVLGQGGGRRFSELKDSERKQFLGDVLGLSMYKELSDKARSMGREAEQEAKIIEMRIERIREEYSKDLAHRDDCKAQSEGWEGRKQEKIADLLRQYEAAQAAYDVNEEELGEALAKEMPLKQDVVEEVTVYTQESKRVEKSMDQVNEEYRLDNQEIINDRVKVESFIAAYNRDIKRMESVVDEGVCPTCGQEAGEVVTDGIGEAGRAIKMHEQQLEEVDKRTRERHAAHQAMIQTLRDERDLHEKKITQLRKQLLEVTEHESNIKRLEQMKTVQGQRVEALYQRIEKAREEKNEWVAMLQKAEEELVRGKEEGIKEKNKKDAIINRKNALAALADAWGPKGARSLLFDGVVPALNERLARYSEVICGQYLAVQVATTAEGSARGKIKEEITLNVHTVEGVVPFAACSGGEQRRMDIPILFALQDVSSAHGRGMGVCFLDEAFESLDGSGADGLFDLLRLASGRACTSSIFVVTHDQDVFSGFTRTMTFRKEMGVSSIV